MDAKATVTLTKEELMDIISTFKTDSEDDLPDTYTLYRYEEPPEEGT